MYKRCLNLFFVLLCFCLQNLFAGDPPKLHVCTFATKETKGLQYLRKSCERYGVPLQVLGLGQPWIGLAQKLHYCEEYAKTLPKTDILMFVDGYDVIIQADNQTILKTFFAMNHPFVIAAERNCSPFPELIHHFPQDTSFRYLNSGTYIGYVSNVLEILRSLRPYNLKGNDQGLLMLDYVIKPQKYRLDTYCQLFLPLTHIDLDELFIDEEHKQVYCLETGTLPCLLHGNGWGRDLFNSFCERFYPEVTD